MRKDVQHFLMNRSRIRRLLSRGKQTDFRLQCHENLLVIDEMLDDMGVWGTLLTRQHSPWYVAQCHGVTEGLAEKWLDVAAQELYERCEYAGIDLKDFDEILERSEKERMAPKMRKEYKRLWAI